MDSQSPALQYIDGQVIAVEDIQEGTLVGYRVVDENALMEDDDPGSWLMKQMDGPNVDVAHRATDGQSIYWFKTSRAVGKGRPLIWGVREMWVVQTDAIWDTDADEVVLESVSQGIGAKETVFKLAQKFPDRLYAPSKVQKRQDELA